MRRRLTTVPRTDRHFNSRMVSRLFADARLSPVAKRATAADVLTRQALKSYLLDMPRGHVFDLTYGHFADVFPPGEPDSGARDQLRILAEECNCDIKNNPDDGRVELTRR